MKCLIISSEQNQALHYFFRKIAAFIIPSEQNQVPHYVFEKRLIFFEEVMKHFILF